MSEPPRPPSAPPDPAETTLDPGRVRPTAGEASDTTLDPGRGLLPDDPPPAASTRLDEGRGAHRPPESPPTTVDPGRVRRDTAAEDWAPSRLPGGLADRYDLVRSLPTRQSQSDLHLVRGTADGREYVLKVYRPGIHPDPEVARRLAELTHPHLVRIVERGRVQGRDYEVMEHAAGGDLDARLRQDYRDGLPFPHLRRVVDQLAGVLAAVHARGVVHRDLKPANILVRSVEPLDLALTDFGIGVADGVELRQTRTGSFAYCPPEFLAGGTSPANDWWALGICLVELSTGRHPLDGLSEQVVLHHVATRPIDLSGVRDERLALLCAGLLTRDPADRWGAEQVQRWQQGETPKVAEEAVGPDGTPASPTTPFWLRGVPYSTPQRLAYGMVHAWGASAERLFHQPTGQWEGLRTWLRQFDGDEAEVRARERTLDEIHAAVGVPADIRLLRLVQCLDPQLGPVYLSPDQELTAESLPELATDALSLHGRTQRLLVGRLWRQRVLPQLGGARGGDGLPEVDRRWRALERTWRDLVARLVDDVPHLAPARAELESETALAALLWLACDRVAAARFLRLQVELVRRELSGQVGWCDPLTAPGSTPLDALAAWLLGPTAAGEAERLREAARAAVAHRAELLREDHRIAWAREDGRFVAAGWAVVPVTLVMVLWVAAVVAADLLPFASPRAVAVAWSGTVVALLVLTGAEVGLAVAIGGPYHPRFSLATALVERTEPIARRVRRHGLIGLLLLIAVLAVLLALTTWLPIVLPVLTVVGHLDWVRKRWREWRRVDAERQEEIRLAREEQRLLARQESPTNDHAPEMENA
ncbi:protein kinase domain-containing protein [Micromonospora arida]|uniref:serine/threonine-protein kinase n=1 Tax=Micromonospora arida TaxID=2203715 RepID=UPI003CF54D29